MFVKKCYSCKSPAVNVLKSSNNWKTLHQFCAKCGKDQTKQVLKVKNMRKSCKNKPRTRSKFKSRALGVALLIWAFMTVFSLPFMSSTVTYAREPDHVGEANEMVVDKSPETILQKIDRIAIAHGLKPEHLAQIISCESRFDPKALNKNKREVSRGLVQINTLVHAVSKEQAENPDFAITFLAKHWPKRHQMWVVCSRGI